MGVDDDNKMLTTTDVCGYLEGASDVLDRYYGADNDADYKSHAVQLASSMMIADAVARLSDSIKGSKELVDAVESTK